MTSATSWGDAELSHSARFVGMAPLPIDIRDERTVRHRDLLECNSMLTPEIELSSFGVQMINLTSSNSRNAPKAVL